MSNLENNESINSDYENDKNSSVNEDNDVDEEEYDANDIFGDDDSEEEQKNDNINDSKDSKHNKSEHKTKLNTKNEDEDEDEDENINDMIQKRSISDKDLVTETNDYFDDDAEDDDLTNNNYSKTSNKDSKKHVLKKSKLEQQQEENEEREKEMENNTKSFIMSLHEACDKDKECLEKNQPALNRLELLSSLETRLHNSTFARVCLQTGLLRELNSWLTIEKDLPTYHIRNKLYNILNFLQPTFDQVRDSDIGKTLLKYYNHKNETKDNKFILKKLIFKWLNTLASSDDTFFRQEQEKATQKRLQDALLYSEKIDYNSMDGHSQAVHAIQAPVSVMAFYKNVKSQANKTKDVTVTTLEDE